MTDTSKTTGDEDDRYPETKRVAAIIDRLLCLLPNGDFNAVDDALTWLLENDHLGLRLSIATRDRMEAIADA